MLWSDWYGFINIYKGNVTKSVWDQKQSCKFLNCGLQIDFWLLKLNVQPQQSLEFDMPGLKDYSLSRQVKNILIDRFLTHKKF